MAVLNNFQKADYVFSGLPWGDGADGSATVSSDPNTRATLSGTATQSTATIGSAILSNGDFVVCHQTQGTGAGNWQVNKVLSGGGSTSITFTKPNNYTYGTGAQIIKIPRYTTATVSAHSVTAWNGTTGGVEIICAKTSITVSGALNVAGGVGATGGNTNAGGTGGGFRGGIGIGNADNTWSYSGESSTSASNNAGGANGAAGGGGYVTGAYYAGGGGAGHAATGTAGTKDSSNTAGAAGASQGAADLTSIFMAAGGGGGHVVAVGNSCGGGGSGGGICILISKNITLSSTVSVNGGAGGFDNGGSGAGGSILMVCSIATLGSNNATSTGGPASNKGGGNGSVGRIAVHHSGTVTGTTNPTFTDQSDPSLVEVSGGFFTFM